MLSSWKRKLHRLHRAAQISATPSPALVAQESAQQQQPVGIEPPPLSGEPNPSRSENASAIAVTILAISRDIVEAAFGIPYVGAVAGVVKQLLEIHDELRTHSRRLNELLDSVYEYLDTLKDLLAGLDPSSLDEATIASLTAPLKAYIRWLEGVVRSLRVIAGRNLYERVADRDLDDLKELERAIGRHNDMLNLREQWSVHTEVLSVNNQVSAVGVQVSAVYDKVTAVCDHIFSQETQSVISPFSPQPLPPRPLHMLERDAQKEQVVKALSSSANKHVIILGLGGIGKTTLACSVMRNDCIIGAFPQRLFISFEGLTTPELVFGSLANLFELSPERRRSEDRILNSVLSALESKKTILCLDNLEAFWEPQENRRKADELLRHLASIDSLSIIVILRGTERPRGIDWLPMDPLEPLSNDASFSLINQIAPYRLNVEEESYIKYLLSAVEGLPLAITLIANLLRDGNETPRSLWRRWQQERTSAIDNGISDRQYHLDVSLKISIFGPRMNDDTRKVLVALAMLPVGLPCHDSVLEEFDELLPSLGVRPCILTLRNAAICSLNEHATQPRLRLLSPIRHFCLDNLPIRNNMVEAQIRLYIRRIRDIGDKASYTWVSAELLNISTLLKLAFASGYASNAVGRATARYTRWARYLGSPTTELAEMAITHLSSFPAGKAACLEVLAKTAPKEKAVELMANAIVGYRKAGKRAKEVQAFELKARYLVNLGRTAEAAVCLKEASRLKYGGPAQALSRTGKSRACTQPEEINLQILKAGLRRDTLTWHEEPGILRSSSRRRQAGHARKSRQNSRQNSLFIQ